MFGLADGSKRRGRHRTRWTEEIQGTMMMNWHDILTATQNGTQMEEPDLQGRGKQQKDETNKGRQDSALLVQKLE
jgi:hypothetical protein